MPDEHEPPVLEPDHALSDEPTDDDARDDRSQGSSDLGCDVPCDAWFDLGCFEALPGLDALDCDCDPGCV